MATCEALATKAEVTELKRLLANKIDKSEEDRIIQSSANIAVPLAITGAVTQLNPGIEKAISASGQALKRAGTALSKTASNAGKIAKNVAGIAGNVANIAGILSQLVSLGLVLKHEFVDLPGIRQQIKNQQFEIEANFRLILNNTKNIASQKRELASQERLITQNRQSLITNTSLILDNKRIINQNKKQIVLNEKIINDNSLAITRNSSEIIRVKQELKSDIQATETKLRNEYKSEIATQIKTIEQGFNNQITQLETNFKTSQATQDRQLEETNAIISGLQNSNRGVLNDIRNIISSKANASELVTVRRRVDNNTRTVESALRTARIANTRSSGGGLSITESNALTETIKNLQLKDAQLTKDINDVRSNALNKEQTQEFRKDLTTDFKLALGSAGLLATPVLLNQINANTKPNAIASATQTGICNSSASGGCLSSKIKNPLSQKMDDILAAFNTTASAGNVALNNQILTRVINIQSVVNSSTNGLAAINNFMRNAWSTTKLDKVLNVLNTVLVLHNALMLSRNLGQTLGDVVSQALQFLNIKDAEGESIDVNEFIGSTVNTWLTNLVGAEKLASIQTTWVSLNRIMVAAQGMVSAVQGVKNAVLESMETVGSWTAKIGNNMQIQGLLEERSFPWMNENINFRNPFGKWMQKIEVTEEILGQVNSLVSSGIEAQENFTELINNSSEITTASQELQNNLAQFDLDKEATEATENTTSASPDINNIDLIKSETES